jgi:hypothetical protein
MEVVFAAQKTAGEDSDYLECPAEFDPHIFDAFKFGKKFMERELVVYCQESGNLPIWLTQKQMRTPQSRMMMMVI